MKDQRINQRERADVCNLTQSQNARYRDEDEENKASNLTKIGGPRTESAFDVRMPETTSAQEVPQRITASRRENPSTQRKNSRCENKVEMQDITRKYKVVNKKILEWNT